MSEKKIKKSIGIDLGSTLSEVSIIENGKPVVIVNEEGSTTTPSVISFKDNERKIGGAAKRQAVICPKETITIIKRFMGLDYDNPDAQKAIKHVQYDVINKNGQPRIIVNEKEYSPEELSSMIIGKMKKIAEDYLGEEVEDAVITVPAFFDDKGRTATKMAGELAGLNVKRIIPEPTAAILSSKIDMNKGGKFMVVDFGGSTEDNSIADIEDGVIEILSTNGDVFLGGTDIDKVVADWIVDEFNKKEGIDLSTDPKAMTRLYEGCEKAKIELSSSSISNINLPYITAKDGVPVHLDMNLTKSKFEQLITPIIDKLISCAKKAVEKAKIEYKDLNGILLIGGSCRIPIVQERIEKEFKVPLIKSSNFDLAVAEGAAIQANILNEGSDDILLLDVIPLAYGIETMGGVMTKIIEENTTIPAKRTQIFTTAVDNQPSVTIKVLNGIRPMSNDNKTVGLFNLEGIMLAKRGVPQIEVTFDIDSNGILTVSAKDMATNKEQKITIENSGSLSKEEIDRIKKEAEEHKDDDEKAKNKANIINECDSLIFLTEKQLEEQSILSDDDKTFFNDKIEELKKMRKDENYDNFESVKKEVESKWYEISSKAYSQSNKQDVGGESSNTDGSEGLFNGFNFDKNDSSKS